MDAEVEYASSPPLPPEVRVEEVSRLLQLPGLPAHWPARHVKYQVSLVALHITLTLSPCRLMAAPGISLRSGHP